MNGTGCIVSLIVTVLANFFPLLEAGNHHLLRSVEDAVLCLSIFSPGPEKNDCNAQPDESMP